MNMIVFEFREAEKKFFEENKFRDFNITFFPECLNEEFVETLDPELLEKTNIISVFINSVVNKNVIDKFKNLRIISTRSTGYDHICVKSCQYKNIAVTNVTNYGETSVAQFTFGLIIALIRKIPSASIAFKNSETSLRTFIGRDLSKLTLGVVGTGAIGAAVCHTANSFGMNILGYDINQKQELIDKYHIKYVSFNELVKASDIISLHLPYTGENYHMFNEKTFSDMTENSYFINTSRGELVDLGALYKYVENGKLKGVALDVLTCENVNTKCAGFDKFKDELSLDCLNELLYVEKLNGFDNVIITPHIAYETHDAIDYILEKTMENIKNIVNGDKMCRIV